MKRVSIHCDGCGDVKIAEAVEVDVYMPAGWFRYEGITMRPGKPAKTLRGDLCSLDCLVSLVEGKTELP